MKRVSFEKYKEIVLDIYRFTESILSKYDIKPIAHSGTLLGIVRHDNDFIPWDDDIDIMVSHKDFNENYDDIKKEVNNSEDYYIVNYYKGDDNLYSNIIYAKVFKKEKYIIEYEGETSERWPFIDIFFAAPADTFKTEIGWKRYGRQHQYYWMTRKGFNRHPKYINNKRRSIIMNATTYPIKLLLGRWWVDRFIAKPYKNTEGNWSILRRVDPWSRREVVYNLDELVESNIRGVKIYTSKNPENELNKTFGKDWRKEKYTKPHIINPATEFHRRNYEVDKLLTSKFGK